MTGRTDSDMLTMLVTPADEAGGDLVMIRALIEEASDLGAGRALARLGLSDATAQDDVRELRELLRGWRDAKRSARNAAMAWLIRLGAGLLLLGLAVKLDLMRLVRP